MGFCKCCFRGSHHPPKAALQPSGMRGQKSRLGAQRETEGGLDQNLKAGMVESKSTKDAGIMGPVGAESHKEPWCLG